MTNQVNFETLLKVFILYHHHERLYRLICSRSRKALFAAWVLFAAAMAGMVMIFLRMGAPALNGIPWDTPMYLDGAWRIINRQIPHKDFFVYIGDLPLYVAWLGMKLGRPGVGAITLGNIFVMLASGLAAMNILQRRTSAFYTCLLSLFIALLAVTPRALGDPFDYTSYAMVYNRYGEAVLMLLGILLFLPPEPAVKSGWTDWAEAGFAGFCLPLLLFCKLNYFAVGVGFFVLACLLRWFPVRKAIVAALSAVLFSGLALSA